MRCRDKSVLARSYLAQKREPSVSPFIFPRPGLGTTPDYTRKSKLPRPARDKINGTGRENSCSMIEGRDKEVLPGPSRGFQEDHRIQATRNAEQNRSPAEHFLDGGIDLLDYRLWRGHTTL
jgi:hypothetical protein